MLNHCFELIHFVSLIQLLQMDHFFIHFACKFAVLIQHISNTAGHSRCEVTSSGTKHDNTSACHIFTAVIAHAFYDSSHAAVSYTEAFSSSSPNVYIPVGSAIERCVPNNNVFFSNKFRFKRREDSQLTARKPFTDIVV